jgi:hypothetical protein
VAEAKSAVRPGPDPDPESDVVMGWPLLNKVQAATEAHQGRVSWLRILLSRGYSMAIPQGSANLRAELSVLLVCAVAA